MVSITGFHKLDSVQNVCVLFGNKWFTKHDAPTEI